MMTEASQALSTAANMTNAPAKWNRSRRMNVSEKKNANAMPIAKRPPCQTSWGNRAFFQRAIKYFGVFFQSVAPMSAMDNIA